MTERPETCTGEKATEVWGPVKAAVMVTVLTVEVGRKVEMLDSRLVGLPEVTVRREGLSGITDKGVLER